MLRVWDVSIPAADANSYDPMKCGNRGSRGRIMMKFPNITEQKPKYGKGADEYRHCIPTRSQEIFRFFRGAFFNLSQPNTTYLSFCSPKPFFDSAPVLAILWLFTTPLSSKRIMRLLVMVDVPPYKGMEDVLVSVHS